MQITQIKVEVKTLNKSLFNQLEVFDGDFDVSSGTSDINGIIGWVNVGAVVNILVSHEGRLVRITWLHFWDKVAPMAAKGAGSLVMVRQFVYAFYHKFPQVFI